MCLSISDRVTKELNCVFEKQDTITVYKLYTAHGGFLRSQYMSDVVYWDVAEDTKEIVATNRKSNTVVNKELDGEEKNQGVINFGLHCYLNGDLNDCHGLICVPLTAKKEHFRAAGHFNGCRSAVFTHLTLKREDFDKALKIERFKPNELVKVMQVINDSPKVFMAKILSQNNTSINYEIDGIKWNCGLNYFLRMAKKLK